MVKETFKQNIIKIIFSFGVSLISWFFFAMIKKMFSSAMCPFTQCKSEFISLMPRTCGCVTFSDFIFDLIIILVPGIIAYIIYSYVQNK